MDLEEVPVELGLPDGVLEEGDDLEDAYLSRIGGRPTWIHPRKENYICERCKAVLYLLLQVDSPLAGFDRVVYVFGCNSRDCTESGEQGVFKVVSQIHRLSPVDPKEEKKKTGLWDSVFAADETTKEEEQEQKQEQEQEQEQEEKGFYQGDYPVGFPTLVLRIVDELIKERKKAKEEQVEVQEGEDGEGYERMEVAGYDKVFKHFHQRVSHYPRQCVRLAPGGQPLLFAELHESPLPVCGECKESLQFDLQLMPAMLSLLPKDDDSYLTHVPKEKRNKMLPFGDGMEWASVMIYSCHGCAKSKMEQECSVIVQIEKN